MITEQLRPDGNSNKFPNWYGFTSFRIDIDLTVIGHKTLMILNWDDNFSRNALKGGRSSKFMRLEFILRNATLKIMKGRQGFQVFLDYTKNAYVN